MGNVINVQMDEDFYNEIIQGGGSGSGSGEAFTIEYYRIDWSKYDQDPALHEMLLYAHVFNVFDNVAVKTIQNVFQDYFKYSKFGGCSIPIYLTETKGENLIFDTGSWLKNFLAYTPYLDAQPSWLVTITKEEFLLFGDDSEYDYPTAP